MILADKIMNLRKKQGMSQEDLANELGISRQSVSKWESAASIPDLDKIIKLSNLFGVSTDYLLKEEIEDVIFSEDTDDPEFSGDEENSVSVSVEEANAYMEMTEKISRKIGIGVVLCILSPLCLIFFGGLSEYGATKISEDFLGGIGVAILLIIIAIAVGLFITYGMQLEKYSYLDNKQVTLQYGVKGIVEKKKENYEMKFRKDMVIGVVLCIVGVIPLIITASMEIGDFICVLCVDVLLVFVAIAVYHFVVSGMIYGSYQKLLQEGDYTVYNKKVNNKTEQWAGAYWCIVTAIYLAVSFITKKWDFTWIIWAVAGVLFGAVCCVIKAVTKEK